MNELLWAASRATALVSIVLLTVTFVLGLRTHAQAPRQPSGRVINAGLHRTLALLLVSFLAIHVTTAIIETYVDIGWLSAIVPFSSSYDRAWIGLGTLAVDLLLAVVVTSLLRDRLPVRIWRGIHLASFALLPIAILHGLTSVTTDVVLSYVVIGACVTVAGAAAALRLARIPADTARRGLAAARSWRA